MSQVVGAISSRLLMKTILEPSGDQSPFRSKPDPGRAAAPVPSALTTHSCALPCSIAKMSVVREKRTLPVDDQDGKSSKVASVLAMFVSTRRPVPSALTTQMRRLTPPRVLEKATLVPSGDQAGWTSFHVACGKTQAWHTTSAPGLVMLRTPVPSGFIAWMWTEVSPTPVG